MFLGATCFRIKHFYRVFILNPFLMKILLVSTSDLRGGAAIAAYRLLEGLCASGVDAKMLVTEKLSHNDRVVPIGGALQNKWNFYYERGDIFMKNRLSRKNLFDVSTANTGVRITNTPEFKEADVVHLHWINQGMLSLDEIGRVLSSGKKVVWTMHDMWAFTGICHHAAGCTNFHQSCGMCPYLSAPTAKDISYKTFRKKQEVYSKGNITFVACSEWLRDLAVQSPLTKNHSVVSVPNPIDTSVYRPKDKYTIRHEMRLPKDKRVILFAAAKVSDKRKGIDYLIDAAKMLAKRDSANILFVVAGGDGDEILSQLSFSSYNLGYVDSAKMVDLYNVADLFVTPSLQENLPNTIMEAMSCGTACVGFDIGGIPEMIQHKSTGYVARYKDTEDLANGISWVLNESDAETLSSNSREFVVRNYTQEKIVKTYLDIYG